jgi:small-conductance mechanosensitive channel
VRRDGERRRFWVRQGTRLATFALFAYGLVAVWSPDAGRLATVAGLATAGIAVALQRVITSFAAYLIILRGRVFTVGDRITIGGVRGDVVALGFMQTSVMEMGEPPTAHSGDPKVWVEARQYTGRIVNVTNDKIFDTPVYNYTREFPYLWEELRLPIRYGDDHGRVERILLDAATMRNRYLMADDVSLEPRVYLRLTDNWIELALRFVAPVHGVRGIKDAMSREILASLAAAGIGIASGTYEIVAMPPLRVVVERGAENDGAGEASAPSRA